MKFSGGPASRVLIPFLFFAFFAQGFFLIGATSPTADEIVFNTVNGYTYLRTGDYRMQPANPALGRHWLALPWLWLRPKLDLTKRSWKEADSVTFAKEFFYEDNRALADRLLYSSRFMMLLMGMGIAALVTVWSRALYGSAGALLSLSFLAFCPTLLGYSAIGGTDIPVTFFVTLTAYFFWKHLQAPRRRDLLLAAFSFGAACASKQNALLFGPVFLLLIGMKKGFTAFVKAALLFAAASFFVVWASYGFEFKPLLWDGVPRVEEKLSFIAEIAPGEFFQKAALETPIPIPTYLLGLAGLWRSHRSGYAHFAFGEWTTESHWYYYLFSFAIKMTLPFLCLLALRLLFFRKAASETRHENAVIFFSAGALFFVTFFDSTAVGVRYLLPVIPMLFVSVGGLAKVFEKAKAWTVFLAALALFNAGEVLRHFPDYLAYFNPLVGSRGYRYVRGSDVDWGQGLKSLKRHMQENGISEVVLEYFGPTDPAFYGIKFEALTEEEKISPKKKVYAISAFYLEHAAWSGRTQPDALIGGCIFLYDLRQK